MTNAGTLHGTNDWIRLESEKRLNCKIELVCTADLKIGDVIVKPGVSNSFDTGNGVIFSIQEFHDVKRPHDPSIYRQFLLRYLNVPNLADWWMELEIGCRGRTVAVDGKEQHCQYRVISGY